MRFVKVGRLAELRPGQALSARVGIRRVAVFNVDGALHAIEDACKHMKAPLSSGRLTGTTLTCGWHGWQYDVTTGACLDRTWGCVRTFAVKVENGDILVSDTENAGPADPPDDEPEEVPTPTFRS